MRINLLEKYPKHKLAWISPYSTKDVHLHTNSHSLSANWGNTVELTNLEVVDGVLYLEGNKRDWVKYCRDELEEKKIRRSIHPDNKLNKKKIKGRFFTLGNIFGSSIIYQYYPTQILWSNSTTKVSIVLKDFKMKVK